jgi:hypothetical protein
MRAGITGMNHHAQLWNNFFKTPKGEKKQNKTHPI